MKQQEVSDKEGKDSRNARDVLQEERYLWMARAFVVMMVLAIICDIILLIALFNVTPVMRVQPFYLEIQDKKQQIISVARPSAETLNSEMLKQTLVRQYIFARFGMTADLAELEERWGPGGPVFWMSEGTIYDEFFNEATRLKMLAQDDNLMREVSILTVNRIKAGVDGNSDIWQVEFVIKESNRMSTKPINKTYVAQLETKFVPTKAGLSWADRLRNPLGFKVVNFALHKK